MADVTVCVPVRGDAAGLARLLRSMHDVDVVVAIDGPDDAVERVARDGGARVVVLPEPRGSYAARNAAVDATTSDLVLFTDADAEVGPGWVEAHTRALEHHDLSGGPVRLELPAHPSPAQAVDAARHLDQRRYVDTLGFAATVNLGARRAVLERVRFDERLQSGGDFEFGQRTRAAGFTIAWTEDAWVAHPPRSSARAVLKKVRRVAKGAVDLQRAGHPASARGNRAKRRPVDVANDAGWRPGPWWRLRAWALDRACTVVYLGTVRLGR